MKLCSVCTRSESAVVLKYCFNKITCGSCKQLYYRYMQKIIPSLTKTKNLEDGNDLKQTQKCIQKIVKCKCKTKQLRAQYSTKCTTCKFLLACLKFDYKVPEIYFKNVSLDRQRILSANIAKVLATLNKGCYVEVNETEQNKTTQKTICKIISETDSKTDSEPHYNSVSKTVCPTDQKTNSNFTFTACKVYRQNNISNWTLKTSQLLSYVNDCNWSNLLLRNPDNNTEIRGYQELCSQAFQTGSNYTVEMKKIIQDLKSDTQYNLQNTNSLSVIESRENVALTSDYYINYHIQFYVKIFVGLFNNTAEILNYTGEHYEMIIKQQVANIWKRFGYLSLWLSGIASLKQDKFFFAPYGMLHVTVSQCFTKLTLCYGFDKGMSCFRQRMKLAEHMKGLSNYQLAGGRANYVFMPQFAMYTLKFNFLNSAKIQGGHVFSP